MEEVRTVSFKTQPENYYLLCFLLTFQQRTFGLCGNSKNYTATKGFQLKAFK